MNSDSWGRNFLEIDQPYVHFLGKSFGEQTAIRSITEMLLAWGIGMANNQLRVMNSKRKPDKI